MPRHLEHFGGGLVTVRDPALLELGEMSVMQNMVYRPGDYSPQRAAGRTAFGAVGTTASAHMPVRGLRDLQFDNGDQFLLAMQEAILASAVMGDTGTFSNFFTYTASGTALEAIHFNDEWFLFGAASGSGASSQNVVAYLNATAPGQLLQTRPHGLIPNNIQVSAATGAGVWTAGATGYFEYWLTELFEYTHNGISAQKIESTFSITGIPFTLFVSSTAMQASINIPGAPINPSANKWVLYRAGPKALATDQEFPTGWELARGTFGGTNVVLDGGFTVGAWTAASLTGNGGYPLLTTPGNVFVSDNTYATWSTTGRGAIAVGFPTFAVTDPIVSIGVWVEAAATNPIVGMSVSISNDSGATWSSEYNVPLTTSDAVVLIEPGTTWGLPFTAAELVSGKFWVRVVVDRGSVPSTIRIDQILAKIHYAGTHILDESAPFPAIVIESSNVDAAVGSHGCPPPATTGDIFQGTLVTNSRKTLANGSIEKSFIRYSLPEQPDYFPDIYYLDFQTSDNDEVTNIKTLNNRLGVFLKSRCYRVNYLPTEADADFNRGTCREEVSSQNGCVNAMCACVYEGPEGRSEIAFVGDNGIFSTNLFSVRELTDDLEWRSIIAATNSTPIALVNDPENAELLFYYKNTNTGSEHYKCLHLNYSARHIKRGGTLKVSGPVNMRNSAGGQFGDLYAAWSVRRGSGVSNTFLGYGGDTAAATAASAGQVFRENATSFPALDSTAKLRTRRMYLSGMGDEFRVDRIFTYVASANTAQTISITPYTTLTNDSAGASAQGAQTRAWAGEKLFELAFHQIAEGLELEIAQVSNNQGHWGPQHVMVDWMDFGIEDSGK